MTTVFMLILHCKWKKKKKSRFCSDFSYTLFRITTLLSLSSPCLWNTEQQLSAWSSSLLTSSPLYTGCGCDPHTSSTVEQSHISASLSPPAHTHKQENRRISFFQSRTTGQILTHNINGLWLGSVLKMKQYLYSGARIQHDVLDGALDVLRPRCEPGHLVVMANLLPLCPWRRFRVLGVPKEKVCGGGHVLSGSYYCLHTCSVIWQKDYLWHSAGMCASAC